MFSIVFWSILAAAIAGLLVKYFLDRNPNIVQSITWPEFIIGMAIISLLVIPGVGKIGWEITKNSTVTYNEYWNGWELAAIKENIQCTRDGPCRYEYDCDPYIVMVSYSCNCDSKGNCSTCYKSETRYHDCPYVTVEADYSVKTTLGNYRMEQNRFPDNPQKYRWRKSVSIPDRVISYAGTGDPPFWAQVKLRINAGKPGPVTTRKTYENYVLASDATILKRYSAQIKQYRDAKLLPKVENGIHDFYLANKVHFVGFRPANSESWQSAVGYLDAALGSELQGDLQLVLVQNQTITADPDTYALALRASWLNKEENSRDAFAKNGIGVIVGTIDGKTVAWAKAFTGMPLGNENMLVAIESRLKGVQFDSTSVVGTTRGWFDNGKVKSARGDGVLESVIWGVGSPETKFKRYSMSGKTGYGGGFLYLRNEIQPTSGQKFWIGFWSFFVAGFVWLTVALIGEDAKKRRRQQQY